MEPSAFAESLAFFGRIREDEPLSRHTTLHVGGPARWFLEVDDAERIPSLAAFLKRHALAWVVLGGGSNSVAPDEGYPGVVICPRFSGIEIGNDGFVTAGAGTLTALFARKVTEAGYTGWEWGVGLPGAIGGAVVGNAGCFGGEVRDGLIWVEGWSFSQEAFIRHEVAACRFGYRESRFKHESFVVVRAAWRVRSAPDSVASRQRLQEIVAQRKQHQPLGASSAGCLFKNVEADETTVRRVEALFGPIPGPARERGVIPAGWLIEQAGLKGFACGNLKVSDRHANFAVTQGVTTAKDLRALHEEVRARVASVVGISLESEVRFLGSH